MKLSVIAVVSLHSILHHASADQLGEQRVHFDIPRQHADSGLVALGQQADITVVYQHDVIKVYRTGELRGEYTLSEAVSRLLENTRLEAKFDSAGYLIVTENKDQRRVGQMKEFKKKSIVATLYSAIVAPAMVVAEGVDSKEGSQIAEEIITTGSRIARQGTSTPTPTTIVDSEQIKLTGELSLGSILQEVPALTAGVDSQSVGGLTFTPETVGVNLANLRGLGTNRTLVLVDGRRHVGSSPGNAAVDLNAIPTALIERVDVITGGASAIYGADAVTGVINVVLKDKYEGFEANFQSGISEFSDAEQTSFSFTAGGNFNEDRGNTYVHFSYHNEDGVRGVDRQEFRFPRIGFRPNPANTGPDDGIPDLVIVENVQTFGSGSCAGYFGCAALPIDPLTGERTSSNSLFVFNSDGTASHVSGDPDPGGSSPLVRVVNPSIAPVDEAFQHIRIPVKRFLLNTGTSYDLTDNHRIFFEGAFARTEAEQDLGATFESGSRRIVVNVADNPFLDDSLRNALLSGPDPVNSFRLGRRNTEFGGRGNPTNRNLLRAVVGLEGELGNLRYDAYYQYGISTLDSIRRNDRIESNFRESVDAVINPDTGAPACRVAVQAVAAGLIDSVADHGCSPLDVFGEQNPADIADAVAYFDFDAQSSGELTQEVFGASLSGSLFQLPAGELGFAAGLEYREESSEFIPSPLNQRGDGFFGVVLPEVAGSFDVVEAYGEVLVPLVSDVFLVQELNVEGAVRWADYSESGSAVSWKFGGDWTPYEDLRFRGAYARSVRAPNIAELFAPSVDNFPRIGHPCDNDLITQGDNPALRAANCAAAGFVPDFDQSTVTPTLRVSGSTDLEPEVAKTLTLGGVITPSFLPGFALSADFWSIELTGAISNLPGSTIAAFCFDSQTLNNPFCEAIDFFPDGNINIVRAPQLNVGRLDASGIDVESTYGFSGESFGLDGEFRLNVVATYLEQLETQLSADAPVDENEGEVGRPKLRGNIRLTYTQDDLTVSLSQRYIGSVVSNNNFTDEFLSPARVDAQWYTNLQARYQLSGGVELFGGANNLFSNDPPRFPGLQDGDSRGSSYINTGRYFYLGAKYGFDI